MSVLERVQADVKDAMRQGERGKVVALRMVVSELQKAAKEGDSDELAVLRRERKRRFDAARAYDDAGRPELAISERAEAVLITTYLPIEMSADELKATVERAVKDSGATSPQDMGVAMKSAMSAVAGRAEGRRVSELVKAVLSR